MKTLKEQGLCGYDCHLKFTTQCLARCDMTEDEQLEMWRARPDRPTLKTKPPELLDDPWFSEGIKHDDMVH